MLRLTALSEILDHQASPVVDLPQLRRLCAYGMIFYLLLCTAPEFYDLQDCPINPLGFDLGYGGWYTYPRLSS